MNNKLGSVLMLILIITTLFGCINKEEFPTTEETIEYLCSQDVEDRKIDKEGNKVVTMHINTLFQGLKLEPIFDDSYLHEFVYGNVKPKNVVGKISGKDNKSVVIISAHFDALFNGAIDNASGVATVLQIAKKLKEFSITNELSCDIMFAMFNGEENAMQGSEAFVEWIDGQGYYKIYNINVDCVGYNNSDEVVLVNRFMIKNDIYDEEYTSMRNNLIEKLEKNKLTVSNNEDYVAYSDEVSFTANNHTSILLADDNVKEVINSENDTKNLINHKRLKNIINSIYEFIIEFKH